MIVLGLDTASSTASCALWQDGVLLGEVFCNVGLTHSQTSLPMVEHLLHQTNIRLEDVGLYGVTAGPGSFTGLRIGISQVKGMAQPDHTPCVPVSTLEGLGWNLPYAEGLIVPCLDARRQQVYTALFQWEKGELVRLTEDNALPVEVLWSKVAEYAGTVTFLGDGAALAYAYGNSQQAGKSHIQLAPPSLQFLRGSSVAGCAYSIFNHGGAVSPEKLEPVYLRLPEVYR